MYIELWQVSRLIELERATKELPPIVSGKVPYCCSGIIQDGLGYVGVRLSNSSYDVPGGSDGGMSVLGDGLLRLKERISLVGNLFEGKILILKHNTLHTASESMGAGLSWMSDVVGGILYCSNGLFFIELEQFRIFGIHESQGEASLFSVGEAAVLLLLLLTGDDVKVVVRSERGRGIELCTDVVALSPDNLGA